MRIIEQLRQDNLFILPLDYLGEWYRYHALFADLLRKRLYQLNPAGVVALHRRASRWFRQNGMFHPAVEHALAGRDYSAMSELIEVHAERILVHGETATFLRWLDSFPAEELHTKPVLVAYQGLALMLSGQRPVKPLAFLQETARSEVSLGEADVLQALYSVMKGDAAEAIRFSELSLDKLPE
jgi:LuxR family maltose regulon positive regulatory protein